MPLNRKYIVLLLLVFGLFVSVACSEETEESKENSENNKVSVEVKVLKGEAFTDFVSVVGTIKPYQKALISSTEGGEIKKCYKDKGDFVNKGDTLLTIDNDILAANLLSAKAQYELAKVTYKKQEMVFNENINSEIQYLQSKYAFQQAKANYELVQTRYENTIILAPFSGFINSKYFDANELAPVGQPILELINVSKVKVEAGVPEKYIGSVTKGSKANIFVNVLNKEITGKVSFIGASVNKNNRTFPIEITIDNKNNLLKPELITQVKIENERFNNLIIISNEIISRSHKGYTVYVVENGIAQNRKIEILKRTQNRVAVKKGLNNGDSLIVVGFQKLVDGQPLNIVN